MKRKTFATFFPNYEDFHFWKDPGQIPFRFSKLGYQTKIITRKRGDYPDTLKYVKLSFLPEKRWLFGSINLILFFLRNSKKTDVLNVFHLHSWESLLAGFLYKIFNKKGFVYLKMDNCHASGIYNWEKIFDPNIEVSPYFAVPKETGKWKLKKFLIKNYFIKRIDLFSVEDEESKSYFENKYSFFKKKIIVAYNGHTIDLVNRKLDVKNVEEKEDLIITVGRLGTLQKNTLNLLKGFASTAKKHYWKLALAGTVEVNFDFEIRNFFKMYPELKNRISFLGSLSKSELFDLYNKSKIFLLSSNFEGFAIVYPEAAYFGNAIITSPYTSFGTIVTRERLGSLVDPEEPEEIGNSLLTLINDEKKLKECSANAEKFANKELGWDKIVAKINSEVESKIKKIV